MVKPIWIAAGIALALINELSAASLEAYGRLPQYENVALSPDGEKAAFVTTIGEQREVIVQPLATKDGVIRLRAGPQKLRDVTWAGTEQLLVTVSQSRGYFGSDQSETSALQNFDLRRKSVFSPMMWIPESWDLLARSPVSRIIDGKAVLYLHGFTVPRRGDRFAIQALYQSNLRDQTTHLIDAEPISNPLQHYQWTIDSRGGVALQSIYDEEKKSWQLFTKKNNVWTKAYSESALIDTPQLIGAYVDNDQVIIRKLEGGKWVLRTFSVTDGKWGDERPDKCCATAYLSDPVSNLIIGTSWQDSRHHYLFFDPALQQKWEQIEKSFPGEEVILESFSSGMKKIVVQVFGKVSGAAYFLIEPDAQSMARLGDLYKDITPADVAAVRPVAYNAADGTQIGGYLTMPQDKGTKNLPLIVMPHGGPASRDSMRFDWFAQALASRGYLVLQPNFRGSWGVGRSIQEAGYGEYGRKMQTDLSDGVNALVKLGIVDPKRVCIVGASYGGYAALAGATMQPDIYKCAVSIAGVADMKEMLEEYVNASVSDDSRGHRYFLRYLGASDDKDPIVIERSPAFHAEKVKGSILLVHGDNDSVVSIKQSQIMANALKKAGKPYEFVKLKSEDHWLSKADTRLQMLQAVVKFLETNNPP